MKAMRSRCRGSMLAWILKTNAEMAEFSGSTEPWLVIRGRGATFNVGGGVVIDSDPETEYAETLVKAKALLNAIGASADSLS